MPGHALITYQFEESNIKLMVYAHTHRAKPPLSAGSWWISWTTCSNRAKYSDSIMDGLESALKSQINTACRAYISI